MTTAKQKSSDDRQLLEPQIRRRLLAGLLLTTALVGGLGGWSAFASIASAVVAPGIVVVEGSDKKVQHPTGGVIGEILVKNGALVKAGDVIVRLDPTQARAALGIVTSELTQLEGRQARLHAERDQTDRIDFSERYLSRSDDARAIAESERRLFDARRKSIAGQKSQLQERIGQLRKEIEGLRAQLTAKGTEVSLMADESERVEGMHAKNLVPVTRALSSERDLTRLKGEHGMLTSNIARAEGQISEIGVQILTLDQSMLTDAMKELRDVEARLSELAERRNAAQDQLNRIEIKAPRTGIVHEMQVHTIGGVIGPGETLMTIVPSEEKLAIEIRLAPTDRDQVQIGQKAYLRFSAFNQRTTPEFAGEITGIAAELTREPQTGVSYYTAHVAVTEAQREEAMNLKLVPGMPVETFMETGQRTAISYFMKPFTDQMARAFKEE
ncbi:MAG: HlyD family type I secretion periplasmic adaptor subunit [Hyphomicrobium sp.]